MQPTAAQPPGFWMTLFQTLQNVTSHMYLFYTVSLLTIGAVVLCVIFGRKCLGRRLPADLTGIINGFLLAVMFAGAILAVGNYTDNFGKWRYGTFFNAYEFYHYYLGSKYCREISCTHLYAASLIADEETGLKYNSSEKTIRNLSTGAYIPVDEVLKNKQQVKDLFSKVRWDEWLKDVRFFKRELVAGRWNGVLRDKGYNATPVWSMLVGGLLSNQVSTDNRSAMLCLASLDLVLISLTVLMVLWAFGPRPALLMILLMGTHYMMKFSHMKGAYLRTDFAMCLVMAICMIKKEHYKIAGALTAYSVLSRVFPAVFLFGLGAKLFWELCRVALTAYDTLRIRLQKAPHRYYVLAALLAAHAAAAAVAVVIIGVLPAPAAGPLPVPWPLPAPFRWFILFPVITFGLTLASSGLWGLCAGRLDKRYVHFFVSFAVTVSILVVASIGYAGGTYLWKDYQDKIGRHNRDISPWRVGFKYIFITKFPSKFNAADSAKKMASFSWNYLLGRDTAPAPAEAAPAAGVGVKKPPAPPKNWIEGMKDILKDWAPYTHSIIYKEKAGLWWSIQAIMLCIALVAVKGLKNHQAMAFSFVPCFFLVSPTYYYYVMLTVPLLFFTPELERPTRALGIIWLFFSGMAGYFFYSMWQQKFPTYFWLSCMLFVFVLYMMLLALLETASPYTKRFMAAAAEKGFSLSAIFPPKPPAPAPFNLPEHTPQPSENAGE